MAETKKYYWLKLDRNFFKRHDIQIIESQKNGKEYVLFYMKLLLEGIDHEGNLRFNEFIPYNDSMLSTITNTDIDVVRNAIKMFEQLEMIEILDDQTIYVRHTEKMLGEGKSTERVKRHRQNQKTLLLGNELENEVCAYCGKEADTIDHIIPKSKGGKDSTENVVAACRKCNITKYQKDVADFINDNLSTLNVPLITNNKKLMQYMDFVNGKFSMKRYSNVTETDFETEIEKEIDIEKEIKEKPNKKSVYGSFQNVRLSDKEIDSLKEKFPDYQNRIENLSVYIKSKGDKYKDHYATILNWARKEEPKTKPKEQRLPRL